MDNQVEPIFESELRVVKNDQVTEKEREEENSGKYDHND